MRVGMGVMFPNNERVREADRAPREARGESEALVSRPRSGLRLSRLETRDISSACFVGQSSALSARTW